MEMPHAIPQYDQVSLELSQTEIILTVFMLVFIRGHTFETLLVFFPILLSESEQYLLIILEFTLTF